MSDERSKEQKEIELGRVCEQFLANADVKELLIEIEKQYLREFKGTKTPAEREQIHARVMALDDVVGAIRSATSNGHIATKARNAREEQEAARRNPRNR